MLLGKRGIIVLLVVSCVLLLMGYDLSKSTYTLAMRVEGGGRVTLGEGISQEEGSVVDLADKDQAVKVASEEIEDHVIEP